MGAAKKENLVLMDGEIMPEAEACVAVSDRGHNFGDGVFEITPVYNGRCFALLPHMNNLFDSLIALKIPAVYMIEELVEFHEELLKAVALLNCEVYTQVTRGSGSYTLGFPEMSVPHLTMFALPTDRQLLASKRAAGVNLVTKEDVRWQRCDINTLNREPEILARQEAIVSRAFDALFVREGKLTETTEASFFVYKDGVIWTHPEGHLIHKNITRRLIKERLAPDLGVEIIERAVTKEFALAADEAFIAGPRSEILPVTKIDRDFINGGKTGSLAAQLAQAYLDYVLRECPLK